MTEKKNHVRPCPHCGATRVECMNAFNGHYPCCSKCEHAPAEKILHESWSVRRLSQELADARKSIAPLRAFIAPTLPGFGSDLDTLVRLTEQVEELLGDAETAADVRGRVLWLLQKVYGVEAAGDDPDDVLFVLEDVLERSCRLVEQDNEVLLAKLAKVVRYRPSILWRSPRAAADAGDVWYCADVYAALGMDAPPGPGGGRALDQATSQNAQNQAQNPAARKGIIERLREEIAGLKQQVFDLKVDYERTVRARIDNQEHETLSLRKHLEALVQKRLEGRR